MEIESVTHKALRKFIETGRARGVIEAGRVRRMIAFLVAAASVKELETPPNFGFHALNGDRAGTYALTLTRNWRMTFTLVDDQTIANLNIEDYH